jgi:hypothetical protein
MARFGVKTTELNETFIIGANDYLKVSVWNGTDYESRKIRTSSFTTLVSGVVTGVFVTADEAAFWQLNSERVDSNYLNWNSAFTSAIIHNSQIDYLSATIDLNKTTINNELIVVSGNLYSIIANTSANVYDINHSELVTVSGNLYTLIGTTSADLYSILHSELIEVSGDLYDLITAISGNITVGLPHNTLSGLQGGGVNDYQHLSSIQVNELESVYSNVNVNSAGWMNVQSLMNSNSGTWNETNSVVAQNSATWLNTESAFAATSSKYEAVYSTVNTISAGLLNTETQVNNLSSSWIQTNSIVNTNSASWENIEVVVNTNSAAWSLDTEPVLSTVSAKYDAVYATVNANSANWENIESTVSNISAGLLNTQTLVNNTSSAWNQTNSFVTTNSAGLENIESVVSSNSAAWLNAEPAFNLLSSKYEASYSTINSSSASWNNIQSLVNTNSAHWNLDTEPVLSTLSAKYESVYSTVNNTSAGLMNVETQVNNLSSAWNQTNSIVASNSSAWNIDTEPILSTVSAKYDAVYATVNSNSSNWNTAYSNSNNVYSTVNNISAGLLNTQTIVNNTSSAWNQTNSIVSINSAGWMNIESVVNANSALWILSGSNGEPAFANVSAGLLNTQSIVVTNSATWGTAVGGEPAFKAVSGGLLNTQTQFNNLSASWIQTNSIVSTNSAGWMNVESIVNTNSALWILSGSNGEPAFASVSAGLLNTQTIVNNTSANWNTAYTTANNVYSTVNSNSSTWGTGTGGEPAFKALSAKYEAVYSTVNNNSAGWENIETIVSVNSSIWTNCASGDFLPLDGTRAMSGDILASDPIYTLGSSLNPFGSLYLSTSSIYLNNEKLRADHIVYPNLSGNYFSHNPTVYHTITHMWSAGKVHGFELVDNGNGSVSLSSGDIFLRDLDSADPLGNLIEVHVDSVSNISLTNNETNYIYADYNNGNPTINVTTDITTISCRSKCSLYIITRVDNTLLYYDIGNYASDFDAKYAKKKATQNWFEYGSGCITSESDTRKLDISAGSFYFINERIALSGFNTNTGTDTFTYIYKSGSSTFTRLSGQTTINNTQYNRLADNTLQTLGTSNYGVHWVYLALDTPTKIFVIYGQADYQHLEEARVASVPEASNLPPEIHSSSTGVLVAKIIIRNGSTNFTEILNPFGTVFTSTAATQHNGLVGLQGGTVDEYYHLTNVQLNNLNSTYSIVNSNSAGWENIETIFNNTSSSWNQTNSIVSTNSANWNLDTEPILSTISGGLLNTQTIVNSNSATWSSVIALSTKLYLQNEVTADPTGWEDPDNITVTYDKTNRTITLNHPTNLYYQYRGDRKSLTNPWTSSAHDDISGKFFLYSANGNTPTWSMTPWDFKSLLVAIAVKNGEDFAMREVHGTMPYTDHQNAHFNIGTYKDQLDGNNGLASLVLSAGSFSIRPTSPTDADNTPFVIAGNIWDEDCKTFIPSLTATTYPQLSFTGSDAYVIQTSASIVRHTGTTVGTGNPVYNSYSNGTYAYTNYSNGNFGVVYLLGIPVTADSDSQAFRYLWLQGQKIYTSQTAAEADDPRAMVLGSFASLFPEIAYIARIVIRYQTTYNNATGRFRIEAVNYLFGGKSAFLSVGGFTPSDHNTLTGRSDANAHPATAISYSDTNVDLTLTSLSGKVDNVYSTVNSNSAAWNLDTEPILSTISGGLLNTQTIVNNTSANWNTAYSTANNVYSTVNSNSSTWASPTNITLSWPSNNNANGIKESITVGESVVFGNTLYLSGVQWFNSDADLTTQMPIKRMALESKSAGQSCISLVNGIARNDSWTWTVGNISGIIYASTTSGVMTQTIPTGTGDQIQIVGYALSANVIEFCPSLVIAEVK